MSIDQETNRLLHLAVAAGIARHCRKFASGGGFGECAEFSRAHLELPAFAALGADLKRVAAFEIFEFVKDGIALPDGGRSVIAAAVGGDFTICWRLADLLLKHHAPGYPEAEPMPIDDVLLA
jgi:hypothetical protein